MNRVREVSVSRMEYFLYLTNHLLHVGGLRADGKPSLVVSVHEVLLARGAAASPAEDLGHSDCTLWVGDLKAQRTQNVHRFHFRSAAVYLILTSKSKSSLKALISSFSNFIWACLLTARADAPVLLNDITRASNGSIVKTISRLD